ncbi:MAG: CDP-glycerol glycerophosphotransferase family protein [Clostridia bacterium]|nr:CDP-glycerol glycerophosphotransferase family protein [Clostridia bacterium]
MKSLFYRLFALFFNISRTLFRIKRNRVVLLSPHNAAFNDSLGEVKAELERRGGYEIGFISHADFSSVPKAVVFFTKKAYLLATAKYVFMNDNFMPLGYLNFRDEAVIVQLWHAEGAFKKFGLDIDQPADIRARELAANKKLSFVTCSSTGVADIYASAFGVEKSKVLPIGSPRADVLLRAENTAELREEFERKYPQSKGKKIVLYAPTFRDDPELDAQFLSHCDYAEFEKALGDTHCLLVRLHPQVHGTARIDGAIDVTDVKNVNDLTLISDAVITDYSSICMDFVLLDKPCVFFAPDLDEYTSRRPFYFDYRAYVPGEIAANTGELVAAVRDAGKCDRADRFKAINLDMVDGKSIERLVSRIFN